MPDIPTALPDRVKVRALIRERGFSIEGVARRIGRPPATLYAITGRRTPKPTGVEILADLAAELSTPARRVRVSDISDWGGDDDIGNDPEPKALASLDANKAPPLRTTGPKRDYPLRITNRTKGLREVIGYTPAEQAIRAKHGEPYATGADDPPAWHDDPDAPQPEAGAA